MIDSKPGLRLPLVYHLVQQRMLDLSPTVPGDMLPAQGELDRPAGPDIHGELPQPAAHPAGEPDRNLPQCPAEMLLIEPVMEFLEPVKQQHVAGAGALAALGSRRRWRVLLHRELEKLALGHAAERTSDSRVEEPNDCLEHPVGRVGVASMNPEDPPVEAEHHRTVRMGDDALYLPQSKHQQSIFEHEVQSRPRFPASPLPGLRHNP